MAIIAFTWTTAAVTGPMPPCETRSGTGRHIRRPNPSWCGAWLPRAARYGGIFLGNIVLEVKPYRQNTGQMTPHDYELEGLAWMERNGLLIRKQPPRVFFDNWKRENESVYVVDFQPIDLINLAKYLELRGEADHRKHTREPAKQGIFDLR